jgi:hypothetical protein
VTLTMAGRSAARTWMRPTACACAIAAIGSVGNPPGIARSQGHPPAGSVVGVVQDTTTGRGIPDAIVRIGVPVLASGAAPPPLAVTDDLGRFAFTALPATQYRGLTVEAGGYAPLSAWGVDGADANGDIAVTEGGSTRVVLSLSKSAAIEGTISDDFGDPVPGMRVSAFRHDALEPQLVASASSDDRGRFRLFGLPAGRYIVATSAATQSVPASTMDALGTKPPSRDAATARMEQMLNLAAVGVFPGEGIRVGQADVVSAGTEELPLPPGAVDNGRLVRVFPTVYYPSALTPSTASAIDLKAGQEFSTCDIRVTLVPAYSVAGAVMLGSDPVPNARVALRRFEGNGADRVVTASAATDAAGRFTIQGVPVGRYQADVTRLGPLRFPPTGSIQMTNVGGFVSVIVRKAQTEFDNVPPTRDSTFGSAVLEVTTGDVHDLLIQAERGVRVGGSVAFTGSTAEPPSDLLMGLRIAVESSTGQAIWPGMQSARGAMLDRTAFAIDEVPRGAYFIRIAGAPQGWHLDSVVVNGVDVSDDPLNLTGDIDDARIVLTDRPTVLEGIVSGRAAGSERVTVVVFPADRARWDNAGANPRRIVTLSTSAGVKFRIESLPPGNYLVSALPRDLQRAQSAQILSELRSSAVSVAMKSGATSQVTVPIAHLSANDFRVSKLPVHAWVGHLIGRRWSAGLPIAALFERRRLRHETSTPIAISTRGGSSRRPTMGPIQSTKTRESRGRLRGDAKTVSGTPIRGATILLANAHAGIRRQAVTDAIGRFQLNDLPVAHYFLRVSKRGYEPTFFGGDQDLPQAAVTVWIDPESTVDASVVLRQQGAITGRAVTARGRPMVGAGVRAIQLRVGASATAPPSLGGSPAAIGSTDDRGVFRLWGLSAGSYLVAVEPSGQGSHLLVNGPAAFQGQAPPVTRLQRFGRTFYPASSDVSGAMPIVVGASADLDIGDTVLGDARGTGELVVDLSPPAGLSMGDLSAVKIEARQSAGNHEIVVAVARSAAPDRYVFENLAEGRFALWASARLSPQRQATAGEGRLDSVWSVTETAVSTGLTGAAGVQLHSGVRLSGRLTIDGKADASVMPFLRVQLATVDERPNRVLGSVEPRQDGSFSMAGIGPGRLSISVLALRSIGLPVRLASVSRAGIDLLEGPIAVSPQAADLDDVRVELTRTVSPVAIKVADSGGRPIADLLVQIFPTDERGWFERSRRCKLAILPDASGEFAVSGLPAGEYFIGVSDQLSGWPSTELFRNLAARGARVKYDGKQSRIEAVLSR